MYFSNLQENGYKYRMSNNQNRKCQTIQTRRERTVSTERTTSNVDSEVQKWNHVNLCSPNKASVKKVNKRN